MLWPLAPIRPTGSLKQRSRSSWLSALMADSRTSWAAFIAGATSGPLNMPALGLPISGCPKTMRGGDEACLEGLADVLLMMMAPETTKSPRGALGVHHGLGLGKADQQCSRELLRQS